MKPLRDDIRLTFYKVLNEDISVADFEKWVYENDGRLADELTTEFHFDLISINYKQRHILHNLQKLLGCVIDQGEFNFWRTKTLLKSIINEEIDPVTASRKLRDVFELIGQDEELIPTWLAFGFEDVLSDVPLPSEYENWNEIALKEELKTVEWYRPQIIDAAEKRLTELEEKEKKQLATKPKAN